MANPDVAYTLEEAVDEILSVLTGLDLDYEPNQSTFRQVVRCLNRAQRLIALEHEWSYYSDVEQLGYANKGEQDVPIRANIRPRIIADDAVRFKDAEGVTRVWAYFLPRDALHKYIGKADLRASVTRSNITFSRPLNDYENGMMIEVPVMREPRKLAFPELPKTPGVPIPSVPDAILKQLIDFDYPDLVIARAIAIFAASDPVLQPRMMALESEWKSIMYALQERDDRATDAPFQNDFTLEIDNDIYPNVPRFVHSHPHADTEDRWPY